ncbi:MAG: WcaI family glycosyltransferase [Bacteroidota bacterium]|nr:WcaI family glycosyltransferase [Bacteroidota bacterium]
MNSIKKRILFIGGNFSPEQTGIGKYSGEMIHWLSKHGYECFVITTYPYYPQWQILDSHRKGSFWYKKEINQVGKNLQNPVTVIRCPHYVPKKPSGLKRILSEFTFLFSSSFVVLGTLFKRKYDFVFTVAPPFHLGLHAFLYKKIKGAKLLYHIQDLQIEVAQNLKIINSKSFFKLLFGVEKFILNRADHISSISAGMIRNIKIKCDKEIFFLPNWVDIENFYPLYNKQKLKALFGLKAEDRIILYSGAIGEKQGLEAILHAAKHFQNVPDLKFVICGSGPYKEDLIEMSKDMKLQNVIFIHLQPVENLNSLLNVANAHLILQKNGASDLTMPSKLSTILAVGGLAIVTASPGSSLYEVINKSKTGILIEPENQEALNASIHYAISNTHKQLEINARQYAENHLSIDKILSAFAANCLNNDKLQHEVVRKEMLLTI